MFLQGPMPAGEICDTAYSTLKQPHCCSHAGHMDLARVPDFIYLFILHLFILERKCCQKIQGLDDWSGMLLLARQSEMSSSSSS